MKKIKFENRPKCLCGAKMKLIKYVGYYDSFVYWECDNCDIQDKMNKAEPDDVWKGSYA